MTAMRSSPPSAAMVASSRAVLPEPGEDIRLTASTPCRSKCSRLCAACRSFSVSRPLSTVSAERPSAVRASAPSLCTRCSLPGVMLQPQVSHIA